LNLCTRPIDSSELVTRSDTRVYWLGNAGALIAARGTILLIDPVITLVEKEGAVVLETGHSLKVDLPIEAREISRADAVLYTHADGDHFGRMTAEVLDKALSPRFYATPPVKQRLIDLGVGRERITTVREGERHAIGNTEVLVTPALHDWNEKAPWKREDCCGFLLRTPDGVVWHPGDTRLLGELEENRGVDVLFFDVAVCNAHLGPEGSARLARTSGASQLIAYHYGTLDVPPGGAFGCEPEDCADIVEGLEAAFRVLNPGEPLILGGRRPSGAPGC
jgi:L-ascorbate metabolism protein UlaG (beta-lactamase superfamily)